VEGFLVDWRGSRQLMLVVFPKALRVAHRAARRSHERQGTLTLNPRGPTE
jgi:hypothetical protein